MCHAGGAHSGLPTLLSGPLRQTGSREACPVALIAVTHRVLLAPRPIDPMSIPIQIPDLGATCEPLRISAWFVKEGELVELDAPVVEIAIGGAVCDVTSPCRGRILGPLRPLDALVHPGETAARVEPIPVD